MDTRTPNSKQAKLGRGQAARAGRAMEDRAREDRADTCYFSATISPHRSLSQLGFRRLFTVLALTFTGVSGIFFALGAWPIIGFMGLEWLGLYWAFRVSYRQADAREVIEVWRDETRLTRVTHKGEARHWCLKTAWVQVINEETKDTPRPLYLSSHGRAHAFGAELSAVERRSLARALRDGLKRARRAWNT